MRSTLSLEIASSLASTSRRLSSLAQSLRSEAQPTALRSEAQPTALRSEAQPTALRNEAKPIAIAPWGDDSATGFGAVHELPATADPTRPLLESLRRWFGDLSDGLRSARGRWAPRPSEVDANRLPAVREQRMPVADPPNGSRPGFPPEVLSVPCKVRRFGGSPAQDRAVPPIPTAAPGPERSTACVAGSLSDFVWKPASDVDGRLVVVLGPSLHGRVSSVRVLDAARSEESPGRCCGTDGGRHTHFRFPRAGASFAPDCLLEATTHDGQVIGARVPNPAIRFEVRER